MQLTASQSPVLASASALGLALLVELFIGTSCTNKSCSAESVAALDVQVIDAVTKQPICGAAVVAKDGAFSEGLDQTSGPSPCYYYGVFERPGTYTVTVSKGGYSPTSRTVTVVEDDCGHVQPHSFKVELTPEP